MKRSRRRSFTTLQIPGASQRSHRSALQAPTSRTPTRHSAAYSCRSGTQSSRAAPSTSGSAPVNGRSDRLEVFGVRGVVGVGSGTTLSRGVDVAATTSSYRTAVMIASYAENQTGTTGFDVRPKRRGADLCRTLGPRKAQLKTTRRRPVRDETEPGYRSGLSLELMRPSPPRGRSTCGLPHKWHASRNTEPEGTGNQHPPLPSLGPTRRI